MFSLCLALWWLLFAYVGLVVDCLTFVGRYIYIVDNKEACGPDVRPVERPWTDFSIIRDLHRGLLYCDAGTTLMGNVLHDSRQWIIDITRSRVGLRRGSVKLIYRVTEQFTLAHGDHSSSFSAYKPFIQHVQTVLTVRYAHASCDQVSVCLSVSLPRASIISEHTELQVFDKEDSLSKS